MKRKIFIIFVIIFIIGVLAGAWFGLGRFKSTIVTCTQNCSTSQNSEIDTIRDRVQHLVSLTNNRDFAAIYDNYFPPAEKSTQNKFIIPLSEQATDTRDYYKSDYLEAVKIYYAKGQTRRITVDIQNVSLDQTQALVKRTLKTCYDETCVNSVSDTGTSHWNKSTDGEWYTLDEFPLCLNRSDSHSTIKTVDPATGIKIISTLECHMFPLYWYKDPVNILPTPLNESEIERTVAAIQKALHKYPVAFLKQNLKSVYLLDHLITLGVNYGSTYTYDAVFVTNSGETNGYTDTYIEQEFHHEFSSILLQRHSGEYDKHLHDWASSTWALVNPPGFKYGSGGAEALKLNQTGREFEPKLLNKGIIDQYGLSSMENDFNDISMNLFKSNPGFWQVVDKYPKIRRKIDIAIAFYHHLDPQFTEEFFRQISK